MAFMKTSQEENVVDSDDLPASYKQNIGPGPGAILARSKVDDAPSTGGTFEYIKTSREADAGPVDVAAVKARSPKILKSFLEKKARTKKARMEKESNEQKINEKMNSNKNTPDVVDAAPQAPPGFSKPSTAPAQKLNAFEEMMSREWSCRSS
jgi:hypothetical protein